MVHYINYNIEEILIILLMIVVIYLNYLVPVVHSKDLLNNKEEVLIDEEANNVDYED